VGELALEEMGSAWLTYRVPSFWEGVFYSDSADKGGVYLPIDAEP